MDLYKEILLNALKSEKVEITFPDLNIDAEKLILNECYRALKEIKNIIENVTISDENCFEQIEKIICVFESIGSDGGVRHDF